MPQAYRCSSCSKVSWFGDRDDQTKCPTCGGHNIELLSNERVTEGMKAGVYFNIDPKTGKRVKPKKR